MAFKDNISAEWQSLNTSLEPNVLHPYTVPEGYFEGLAGQVLRRIRAMEIADSGEEMEILSPYLSKISRKTPFEVPVGYFENLDLSFVTVDAEKELEVLSPLLSRMEKKMPFEVPAGYFDTLQSPVQNPVSKTRIVPLRWVRFAAAAIVTGMIVLAAFYLRGDKEPGMKVLAKVTRDVQKMNELQKDDLLDFIDAGLSGDESVQVNSVTRTEINTLIQGVSEEELKDFEEQTEDIQDVLMTN